MNGTGGGSHGLNCAAARTGGEGLLLATLRGHGRIWLQSLPFSRLVGRAIESMPVLGGRQTGEGSILPGAMGLFQRK